MHAPHEPLALRAKTKSGQSEASSAVDVEAHKLLDLSAAPADSVDGVDSHQRYEMVDVSVALKKLWSSRLRTMVHETGVRSDGRKADEVGAVIFAHVKLLTCTTSLVAFGWGSCSNHNTRRCAYCSLVHAVRSCAYVGGAAH
jgi:hypothetical protein